MLIVDDHAAVRESLKLVLSDAPDLEVVGVVGRGDEAVAFCREQSVDLVLLDVRLPDRSGDEVVRELLADDRVRWIVAMSMDSDEHVRRLMLDAGACDYVDKASAPGDLLRTLRERTAEAG